MEGFGANADNSRTRGIPIIEDIDQGHSNPWKIQQQAQHAIGEQESITKYRPLTIFFDNYSFHINHQLSHNQLLIQLIDIDIDDKERLE